MRTIIIFFIACSFSYGQCDISVEDIVSKIDCDQLAAHCPDLGGGEIKVQTCTGTFENCSNSSGNRFVRPASTVNLTWEYTDWARVGVSTVTSPDCVTDLQVVANLGDRYFQNDNSCIYSYFDTRLLIDGSVVLTRVAATYDYECSFSDRLDIDLDDISTVTFHRDDIPVDAVIEVEFRMRSLYASMTNPSPSARIVWSGIKSEASFSFHEEMVVTDVALSDAEPDKYWIKEQFSELPFASSYSYGEGGAPEGAKTYGSQTAQAKQLERTQKELDEILQDNIDELEKID